MDRKNIGGGKAMELSLRLKAIASLVPAGSVPADIGTDHAYLPVELVKAGVCSRAIAGDIHRGPFLQALERVEKAGLADCISVRLGDGLAILQPGEADGIIIAGMGGQTLLQILAAGAEVLATCQYLILQPMTDVAQVRAELDGRGWFIDAENLVKEEGKFYQIIKYTRQPRTWDHPFPWEIACLLGPALLARRHPMLLDYLHKLMADTAKVIQALAGSQGESGQKKRRELQNLLVQLREVETWLKSCRSSAG